MKNPFGNMQNIMKQAQAMQEQMAKVQEGQRPFPERLAAELSR